MVKVNVGLWKRDLRVFTGMELHLGMDKHVSHDVNRPCKSRSLLHTASRVESIASRSFIMHFSLTPQHPPSPFQMPNTASRLRHQHDAPPTRPSLKISYTQHEIANANINHDTRPQIVHLPCYPSRSSIYHSSIYHSRGSFFSSPRFVVGTGTALILTASGRCFAR